MPVGRCSGFLHCIGHVQCLLTTCLMLLILLTCSYLSQALLSRVGFFFVAPISSRGLQVTFVPLCSNLCAQQLSMLSCGCDEQVRDGGGRPLAGGCAKAGS